MSPALEFRNVTRRYGDVVALNRVDLEVDGGILALVGPNGSGKSTFMRLATGHAQPSSGTIQAFGEPVWANIAVNRRMGCVPEQDAFYGFMSGLDFVATLAGLQGLPAQQSWSAAEEELENLGLGDAMYRPIKGYSKGMRQRVKLAQALVHAPELLFLDEPLLGCDPVARRRITDRVRALRDQGCTVVVSSHILPEVERLTRDVAILLGGRLVATGDSRSVRDALRDVPCKVRLLTPEPRKVATAVAAWASVEGVRVRDDCVDVEATGLQSFINALQAGVKPTWKLQGWETLDSDLDSVFGYLAGGGA